MIPNENSSPGFELCGGTLISESHVLTARHCISVNESVIVKPKNVKLTAGRFSRNDNSSEEVCIYV